MSVSGVYSVGSPVASLILSGALATLRITVSPSFMTASIPLYRSDDYGVSYGYIGTCVIGSDSLCSFITNHFSLFALGTPSFPVVSGGSSSSSASGPGG